MNYLASKDYDTGTSEDKRGRVVFRKENDEEYLVPIRPKTLVY